MLLDKPGHKAPPPGAASEPGQGRGPGSTVSPPRCPGPRSASGTGHRDGGLDRLRRQYPRWRIWRGRATGDYWAMPPPDHPTVRELICANDVSEMSRRLARVEGQHGP